MQRRPRRASDAVNMKPAMHKQLQKEERIQEAVFAFNTKPKTGLAPLCEVFSLPETPRNIAHLLHTVDGIRGDVIGNFLAKKDNESILTSYFNEVDMKVPFVDAMRIALSGSLRLPGEAEQIDHIVEVMAECYLCQNPSATVSSDHLYILAFALILLNSDLHNPQVAHRMTPAQFMRNIRNAISEEEMSDQELARLYDDIRDHPFEFNQTRNEVMAMSAPRMKGFIKKKSDKILARMKSHYFVLANSCLYYFKNKSSDSPLGMITLVGINCVAKGNKQILIRADGSELQYVKFARGCPELVRGVKSLILEAQNDELRDKWLYLIIKSSVYSNFNNQEGLCQMNTYISQTESTDQYEHLSS